MLRVENISVSYGSIRALDGVNLEARDGKFTVILGANGAGKTTVVKALAGLVPLQKGLVRLDGHEMSMDVEMRPRLGVAVVPERRQLWHDMTVEEHLVLGAYRSYSGWQKFRKTITREVSPRIEEILEQFPALRSRFSQRAGTLSGGEQQMLALARAMSSGPKMIVLDEPTVGLSPLMVEGVFVNLQKWTSSGGAVLLAEQNAEAALYFADYGYVLQQGKIVAQGPGAKLRENGLVEAAYLGSGGIQADDDFHK